MPENYARIEDLARTYQRLKVRGEVEFPALMAVTLAQWMLESFRGTSKLATEYFNFAGLKFRNEMRGPDASGDDRGAATPVTYVAHDGRDEYCRFHSLENFIFGYWRFIARAPYRGFNRYRDDPEGYIQFLKDCGYAGDPDYVRKVLSLLPEAEALLHDLAQRMPMDDVDLRTRDSSMTEESRVGRGSDRRSRRTRERRDAIHFYAGDKGLVEEWENAELIADAETGRDVDRLLEFLDTTEVLDYVLLPDNGAAGGRRGSNRSRRAEREERVDGVYFFNSPEGRVEEWEAGKLVAKTETGGDVDALLDFLDQTLVMDYFIEFSTRRGRRRGRSANRSLGRNATDASREARDEAMRRPIVPMDEDDAAEGVRGVLEGFQVALDVGHGMTARGVMDPGAVNDAAGIREHDLNRIVAHTAAERLRAEGALVSVFLYGDASDRRTLLQKGRRAHGQDVFVSCHHNSAANRSAQGAETLLTSRHNTEEDTRLATAVQDELVSTLGLRDRGVKIRALDVLTGAGAGVKAKCLIEPFFISEGGMTLAKAEGMARDAGEALAEGIADYWLRS